MTSVCKTSHALSTAFWRWTAFSAVLLLAFLLLRAFAPRPSPPGGTQPVASDSPSPPSPAPPPAPSFSPDSCIEYTTQPGDTLRDLAQLFSTPLPLLSSANPGFPSDTPLPPRTVLLIPPSP